MISEGFDHMEEIHSVVLFHMSIPYPEGRAILVWKETASKTSFTLGSRLLDILSARTSNTSLVHLNKAQPFLK